MEILKFYRGVDEGIARARNDLARISQGMKIIN
jgi:hypothetical protein